MAWVKPTLRSKGNMGKLRKPLVFARVKGNRDLFLSETGGGHGIIQYIKKGSTAVTRTFVFES